MPAVRDLGAALITRVLGLAVRSKAIALAWAMLIAGPCSAVLVAPPVHVPGMTVLCRSTSRGVLATAAA